MCPTNSTSPLGIASYSTRISSNPQLPFMFRVNFIKPVASLGPIGVLRSSSGLLAVTWDASATMSAIYFDFKQSCALSSLASLNIVGLNTGVTLKTAASDSPPPLYTCLNNATLSISLAPLVSVDLMNWTFYLPPGLAEFNSSYKFSMNVSLLAPNLLQSYGTLIATFNMSSPPGTSACRVWNQCATIFAICCDDSFSPFYFLAAPLLNVQSMQVLNINGSSDNTVTLLNASFANITTLQSSLLSTFLNVTFASVLPPSVSFLAFMIPVDKLTLQTVLGGSTSGTKWPTSSNSNADATIFQDRLLVHTDAQSRGSELPVRWLSICVPTLDLLSLQCKLPAAISGSLWRVYIHWYDVWRKLAFNSAFSSVLNGQAFMFLRAYNSSDGSLVLPAMIPVNPLPMLSVNGLPLTVSFPMATLTPGSARRFQVGLFCGFGFFFLFSQTIILCVFSRISWCSD